MRTHVILPDEIVEQIDGLVGKGKRSKFVEEAVREKLRIDRALAALDATFGICSAEDYPEWATPESTYAWVRKMREEADESMRDKWKERE